MTKKARAEPEPFNLASFLENRKANPNSRDPVLTQIALARDCGICQVCGIFWDGLEGHHIQSIVFDGKDELNNIITLCNKCHKAAPTEPSKFLAYQKGGGPLWEHILNQALRCAAENPGIAIANVISFVSGARESLFGQSPLFGGIPREDAQTELQSYYWAVSGLRKKYYGEPLPAFEEHVSIWPPDWMSR